MSSNTTANMPLSSYAAAWGPSLVSTFIASVIYGITVLQTFYYYRHYGHRDKAPWIIFVGAIFALDTAALALFMYCMYYYLVLSWGSPDMLAPDVKEFPSEYFLTSILTLLVQLFYINTIRALRAPIGITVFLLLVSITAFGSGLILPIVQLRLKLIPVIVNSWINHAAFNIARSTALACDLGIVAALCWLLARQKTEIQRADSVLDTIMMFAVQRGILQAVIQGGEVISYAVEPSSVLFLPFHVIVSRIYCTSVLATLNSRKYVLSRGRSAQHHPTLSFVAATSPIAEDGGAAPRGGNQWASVIETSQPVLSSYFDPPFLISNSCSTQDIEACRSGSERLSTKVSDKRFGTHTNTVLECAAGEDPVSAPGMQKQAFSSAEEKLNMQAGTVLPSLHISD